MTATQPTIERVRFPPVPRLAEVIEIVDLTPKMRRFVLQGEDLKTFDSQDADDHMKLVFPAAGQREPTLPVVTEEGLKLPEGAIPSERRDFTPRAFDRAAGTLTVDFFLHGSGPAGSWAQTAETGSTLGVLGPRGSRVVTGGDLAGHPFEGRSSTNDHAGHEPVGRFDLPCSDQRIEKFDRWGALFRSHGSHLSAVATCRVAGRGRYVQG